MKRGSLFLILGALLVALAVFLVLFNVIQANHAGNAAIEVLDQLSAMIPEGTFEADSDIPMNNAAPEVQILNPDRVMPILTVDGVDYIGILRIPALGLELPIISQWTYEKLQIAPCRYTGSAYSGNLTICAHNYPAHFGNLKELSIGDEVSFTDVDGNLFVYQVGEIETLPPTAVDEITNSDWDLSLFTCTLGGQTRFTIRCQAI